MLYLLTAVPLLDPEPSCLSPSPLMVSFPSYQGCTVLWSDHIQVYVSPPSAKTPPCDCSPLFRLKVNHPFEFAISLQDLWASHFHISCAGLTNDPCIPVLAVMNCRLSDTNAICLPREHLRPSILESIMRDPSGVHFSCSHNNTNTFLGSSPALPPP